MSTVNAVLKRMSSIKKPQRTFLIILLTTLMHLPGKVTFRNLSHYSDPHGKTYSRRFQQNFNFCSVQYAKFIRVGH